MKRKLFFFLLSVFPVFVAAQQRVSITLEDAIAQALKNNYGQQILEISGQISTEDVAQSKRNLWPSLSASLSQGVSNVSGSGNYSVSASATLWSGGQAMNAIRKAKVSLDQSDSQLAQNQNNLSINVIQAFLTVLMNDELYRYQSEVVEISRQQMEQGQIKLRSGDILESDYLLLKSQWESDRYAMTNSRTARDNAMLELKTLLSLDPTTEIDVITPADYSFSSIDIPSLATLIDETMAWLPDLKIASQNIELAQIDRAIAKGGLFPTVSLSGSIGTSYNEKQYSAWGTQFTGNNVNQLALTVSIPLWNKGQVQSKIKQADYKTQQAQIQSQQTELELRSSLTKEHQDVLSMREKYTASEISAKAYEESFRVFSTKFEAGSISTTELLQQQNNYLSALNTFLQSKYSLLLNCKVLDVYMGKEIKI